MWARRYSTRTTNTDSRRAHSSKELQKIKLVSGPATCTPVSPVRLESTANRPVVALRRTMRNNRTTVTARCASRTFSVCRNVESWRSASRQIVNKSSGTFVGKSNVHAWLTSADAYVEWLRYGIDTDGMAQPLRHLHAYRAGSNASGNRGENECLPVQWEASRLTDPASGSLPTGIGPQGVTSQPYRSGSFFASLTVRTEFRSKGFACPAHPHCARAVISRSRMQWRIPPPVPI